MQLARCKTVQIYSYRTAVNMSSLRHLQVANILYGYICLPGSSLKLQGSGTSSETDS
jgi:hypothetical protein